MRDVTTHKRLDKWLWHARVVRTRSLAAALVAGGHVRVNRERVVKPGRVVRPGDVITASVGRRIVVLRVEGFSVRRGSAAQAGALYTDLSPPPPAAPDGARAAGSGRPTKRDRRALGALKQRFAEPGDFGE